MKKRQGFVSNSSTTSFCIYGAHVKLTMDMIFGCFEYVKFNHPDFFKERLEKVRENWNSSEYSKKNVPFLDLIERFDDLNDEEKDELSEFFEMDPVDVFSQIMDLEYWSGPDYGSDIYVGRSWDSIGDDETGKQFKDSIEEDLVKVFGDSISCGTYEEAWRDG